MKRVLRIFKISIMVFLVSLTAMTSVYADDSISSEAADQIRERINAMDTDYLLGIQIPNEEAVHEIFDLYQDFEELSMEEKCSLGAYELNRLYILMSSTSLTEEWSTAERIGRFVDERYGFDDTVPFSVFDYDTMHGNTYAFKPIVKPVMQRETRLVFYYTLFNDTLNEWVTDFESPVLLYFSYPQYELTEARLDNEEIPFDQAAGKIIIAVDHPGRIDLKFKKAESISSGWVEVDYEWQYFDENGFPYSGWVEEDGEAYFVNEGILDRNGPVEYTEQTKQLDDGNVYYTDETGRKLHDTWLQLDGKWTYLQSDGTMLKNVSDVWILDDTYSFDENGVWIPETKTEEDLTEEPIEEVIQEPEEIEESESEEEEIVFAHPRNKESDIVLREDKVNIYLFWGNGCGHCEHLFEYLESLDEQIQSLYQLYSFETWYDEENNQLMQQFSELSETKATGVPYMIIGDEVFLGYDESINEAIVEAIVNADGDLYAQYLNQ